VANTKRRRRTPWWKQICANRLSNACVSRAMREEESQVTEKKLLGNVGLRFVQKHFMIETLSLFESSPIVTVTELKGSSMVAIQFLSPTVCSALRLA
jgi:hypothetical protein